MTPRRLADRLHAIGEELARSRLRLRALALYLEADGKQAAGDHLDLIQQHVGTAAIRAVDLAAGIRAGLYALAADLVDVRHTPERPLIDRIEAEAIGRRLTDAERERIVERGDTGPEWEVPASANGASRAPKPRKAGKKGGAP